MGAGPLANARCPVIFIGIDRRYLWHTGEVVGLFVGPIILCGILGVDDGLDSARNKVASQQARWQRCRVRD